MPKKPRLDRTPAKIEIRVYEHPDDGRSLLFNFSHPVKSFGLPMEQAKRLADMIYQELRG